MLLIILNFDFSKFRKFLMLNFDFSKFQKFLIFENFFIFEASKFDIRICTKIEKR